MLQEESFDRFARATVSSSSAGRSSSRPSSSLTRSIRRLRRACMSSTCIKRPLRMIATRSATCSTSASTWPEKITVCPSFRASCTSEITSDRADGSSAEVGSSRMRMSTGSAKT